MTDTTTLWLTSSLFALTYAALAVGKIPRLRIDRAGIAFLGAAAMVCTGLLSLEQATAQDSIDYQTLFLLFGMMVVVGFLRLSGVFIRLAHASLDRIRSPKGMLAVVILLSGVLSAFLVNDIVCLALTPLVLHLTKRLGFKPVPHLIALATAANIGSAGTITGNPQNMFIGAQSQIAYLTFALHLMPVAMLGLVIDYFVILFFYRTSLAQIPTNSPTRAPSFIAEAGSRAPSLVSPFTLHPSPFPSGNPAPSQPPAPPSTTRGSDANVRLRPRLLNRPAHIFLQWKSVIVALLAVILFFTGLPIALVAIGAAAVLMVSRIKPARIYREIDWSLLLMFIGLFIVVHAFQLHVVSRWGVDRWHLLLDHPVGLLSIASAALSNLVSNVPAVLLFEPVLHAMTPARQQTAWLALAMSSTFAGNLTILGSVANLIVVETARREGVEVSFWEYCKAGVPVTVLTLALGIGWLWWVG